MRNITNLQVPVLKQLDNSAVAKSDAAGALIINADDWGRDRDTTDKTLDCVRRGAVSSVSAMVFMEDSERAAALAREHGIDAGLHLNLTTGFTAPNCPPRLLACLQEVAAYLLRHPISRVIFHPWLASAFEYLVTAQRQEFARLYGEEPARVDGHHHMHLSANVIWGGLLPARAIVRRHFSYEAGEKAARNWMFRRLTEPVLSRRYQTTDHLFSLAPLQPQERLGRILSLARHSVVELETHPINPDEHHFLFEGEIFNKTADLRVAAGFSIPGFRNRSASVLPRSA
jgi:hypothetical protein